MFPGCLQDFSRMFSGCSNGSCGPGGIWWTFQMKGIRSSPTIWWSQLFDDRQLFDDQLEVWTLIIQNSTVIPPSLMVLFSVVNNHVQTWIWWFGSFSASLDSLRIQEGQFWVFGTFVTFFCLMSFSPISQVVSGSDHPLWLILRTFDFAPEDRPLCLFWELLFRTILYPFHYGSCCLFYEFCGILWKNWRGKTEIDIREPFIYVLAEFVR